MTQDEVYMQIAYSISNLSKCERKKVGCVIVKDSHILSEGCNGGIRGGTNCCEDEDGNTKPEIIHAEQNAILKAARAGVALDGASIYLTLTPCVTCAIMIAQVGIKEAYYSQIYRSTQGIDFLNNFTKVKTKQIFM